MVKIQRFNGQYRITIPKNIVQLMDWNKDTELVFLVTDSLDKVTIKELLKKGKDGKREA